MPNIYEKKEVRLNFKRDIAHQKIKSIAIKKIKPVKTTYSSFLDKKKKDRFFFKYDKKNNFDIPRKSKFDWWFATIIIDLLTLKCSAPRRVHLTPSIFEMCLRNCV